MRPSVDHPHVVCFPPLIYTIPLLISLITHVFFPWYFLKAPWPHLFGWPMLISGFLLAVWGKKTMEQAGTNVNPYHPTESIVTKGPFRFTRNPLYIALTLIYVSVAVIFNSLWPLAVLPAILVVIHYGVIKQEEAYLERKFGAEYADYKSKVRRWI